MNQYEPKFQPHYIKGRLRIIQLLLHLHDENLSDTDQLMIAGIISFVNNKFKQSAKYFEKLLVLQPNNGIAMHNLAVVYLILGKDKSIPTSKYHSMSMSYFDKLDNMDPQLSRTYKDQLGIFYYSLLIHERNLFLQQNSLNKTNSNFQELQEYQGGRF